MASAGVFLVVTLALQQVTPPLAPLFACALASFALGLLVFPPDRTVREGRTTTAPSISPRWEIAARMALATALVLLVTGISSALGLRLSGLLSPFPVYAAIYAVFTQRSAGAEPSCG